MMGFTANIRAASGGSVGGRDKKEPRVYNLPVGSIAPSAGKYSYAKASAPAILGGPPGRSNYAQAASQLAPLAKAVAPALSNIPDKDAMDKLAAQQRAQAEAAKKIAAEKEAKRLKDIADQKAAEEAAKLAQQQAATQTGADTVGWLGRRSVFGPDWTPGDPIPKGFEEHNIIGNKVSDLGRQAVEGVKNLSLLSNLNLDTKPKDPKNLSWWDKFKMNLDKNVLDDKGNMIASAWSTPDSATYMNPETFDFGGISNPWEDIKAGFGLGDKQTTTAGTTAPAGPLSPNIAPASYMSPQSWGNPNTWDPRGSTLDLEQANAPRNYGDPAISYPPASIDDLANMSLPSNEVLTKAWNTQYGDNMSLPSNEALTDAWNNQYGEPELIGNIPGKYAYTKADADPILDSDLNYYEAGMQITEKDLTTPPRDMSRSEIGRMSRAGFKWNPVAGKWEVNTGRVWADRHAGAGGDINPQVDAAGTTDYPMNHSQIVNPWTPEVPVSNPYRHVPRVADPQGFDKRRLLSGDVDYMNQGGVAQGGGIYHDAPIRQWMKDNKGVKPRGMSWDQFLQLQYQTSKARQEAATTNALNQQKAKQQQQKNAFGTLLGIANPTAGSVYNAYSAYANDGGVVHANEGMSPYNPMNWLSSAFGIPEAEAPGMPQQYESGPPPTEAMMSANMAKSGAMPDARKLGYQEYRKTWGDVFGALGNPLKGSDLLPAYLLGQLPRDKYEVTPSEQSEGKVKKTTQTITTEYDNEMKDVKPKTLAETGQLPSFMTEMSIPSAPLANPKRNPELYVDMLNKN